MNRLSRPVRRVAAAAALVALLGGTPVVAQKAQPTSAKKQAPPAVKLPAVERFTLDNGLEVAFLQNDAAPVVSVQVWYHVGSKDEARNRRGSAHMFEHMLFKGSDKVPPEEHARHINRLGGYVNATTTEDATFYYQTLPAQYLDFALELEAERMRNLVFREEMVKTEREVVKEEIRQQENSPVSLGLLRFLEIAYQKHPYAWTAGGTIADLDATTPADLEKFYDTYYVPNNALLVIAGDTTLDEVKAATQKHFGKIPKGAAPPRPADSAAEPEQKEQRREVVAPAHIGVVITGFKIPESKHADIYALQLLSLVLGEGESSRLRQRIKAIDKKSGQPLGVEAVAQLLAREHPGLLVLFGVFTDPAAAEKVETALYDEVAKVAAKGISAAELDKAKSQIRADFVFGLEGTSGLGNQIGLSWILTGDPGQFLRDLDELEKVTVAQIQDVAKKYLTKDRSTVVIVPPGSAGGQE